MNKYENKINESNLLGDKFPHSLLVIEGVQELFRMVDGKGQSGKGNLAVNYFDSMLLRLNVCVLTHLLNNIYHRTGQTNGTATISL